MPDRPLALQSYVNRYRNRVGLLLQYGRGQGLLQILQVLNGFFLLRWLSIDEQAKFSLAMSLQATVGLLGDMGLGGSLLGLIGSRTDDKIRIGQYIRGLQRLRIRLLLGSAVLGGLAVYVYHRKQAWGADIWLMYGLLLISLGAQSITGYYSALLQMKGYLRQYYGPQLLTSGLRLGISGLLACTTGLSALWVLVLTTAGFLGTAGRLRQHARLYYDPLARADTLVRQEIVEKVWPVMPMVAFYAVQGQLVTFLAGYYGVAQNLADLSALARLGQLFALLTPFNTVVLMPYVARCGNGQVPYRLGLVLLGALGLILPVCLLGHTWPEPFVWLLGDRYINLRVNIGPYILSASVWYLSSIVWAVNAARQWNRWSGSALYVLVVLGVQAAGVRWLDLSATHELIRLNLFTGLATLGSYLVIMTTGLRRHAAPPGEPSSGSLTAA